MSLFGEHSLIDMTSRGAGGEGGELEALKAEPQRGGRNKGERTRSVDGRRIYYVYLYCCYDDDLSL